ncbi:MAG: 50S ribosomal protein L10 [Candidatus Aenigmatarchaeota archaeon]
MVSEKNKNMLKSLSGHLEDYPVIGIVDMHNLPSRQLHQIKEQLKGKAVITVVKKRVIMLALKASKKPGLSALVDKIQSQPALLFSRGNPFELANDIAKSKSKAAARPGDIAPKDIIVSAGPTSLPPGPAIGELQKAKIQAGVVGDKIVIKKDALVARKGDVITPELASLLPKLGIEPMEIELNLIAVWDEGTVFGKDILFIPQEQYVAQLQLAYSHSFNLAVSAGYMTPETVPVIIGKAHREAISLALAANIITHETAGRILAKATAQADALKALVKDAPAPAPAKAIDENAEAAADEAGEEEA